MNSIDLLRLVRDIGREANRRGFHEDILRAERDLPRVGTLREQMAIATIGVDAGARLSGPSTRERELVSRLCRAAVLPNTWRSSQ